MSKKIKCSEEKEKKFKKRFDININPRKWIGVNGHTLILGDLRIYVFEDKDFENWINKAYDALMNEGLDKLQKEFLSDQEIEDRKNYMNDY